MQDELPRTLSMPLTDAVFGADGVTVLSVATRPSLTAVRRWIAAESRWIDGRLRAHVAAVPLTDPGAVELVRPIVVWRVAVRVLIALDFDDESEVIRTRRSEARFRLDEILRDTSMLGTGDAAAAAALVASIGATGAPDEVVAEAERRVSSYLAQSPATTTMQGVLRGSGALALLRPWRRHRAGLIG